MIASLKNLFGRIFMKGKIEMSKTYVPRPTYTSHSVREPENTLQASHQTAMNRFPKIFESAKKLYPDAKRILSFGCSTGEECFTLADLYPQAEIVGVDIDYSSIAKARKVNKFKDRVFFHTDLGATGKYDLITCLMVLFSIDKPITFERFENTINLIDKYTNEYGLLMIYTAEYNPRCTDVIREKYEAINEWTRNHNKTDLEYWCGYYKKRPLIDPSFEEE